MAEIDTTAWTRVGQTANTEYFLVEPNILAGVPFQGARDDFASATENQRFQNEYFRNAGSKGVIVVFFDRMVAQDAEARRVYGVDADLNALHASALVGGTVLSRAIISFFLGMSRPRLPVKLFGTGADAIAWARELIATAGR
jgi:hypothetical protein